VDLARFELGQVRDELRDGKAFPSDKGHDLIDKLRIGEVSHRTEAIVLHGPS